MILLLAAVVEMFGCQRCEPLEGTDACPFDSCATDCSSPAEVVQCCTAAHGHGLTEEEFARVSEFCDSRESPCDSRSVISNAAAVCIAQASGLPPGIGSCGAALHDNVEGPKWVVVSLLEETCPESGDQGESIGAVAEVDAVSGATSGIFSTLYASLECP